MPTAYRPQPMLASSRSRSRSKWGFCLACVDWCIAWVRTTTNAAIEGTVADCDEGSGTHEQNN